MNVYFIFCTFRTFAHITIKHYLLPSLHSIYYIGIIENLSTTKKIP